MDILKEIFTDQQFLGAIISSILFIAIGFYLRMRKLVNDTAKDVISIIALKVAIPCMAFCGFMSKFDVEALKSNLVIVLLYIIITIIILVLGNLIFFKTGKGNRQIYGIFMAIGQLTFFSIPLLKAIYADNVSAILIPTSLMTIPFRVFIYIYAFIAISSSKIDKSSIKTVLKNVFLNPAIIMMVIGFIIWSTQNLTWQVKVEEIDYGFLRIDKTCPALYTFFKAGDYLATPLCMLLIGISLGESNFSSVFKNGRAWLVAISRTIIAPAIVFSLCLLVQLTTLFSFTEYQFVALVVGFSAPISAVIDVYCSKYKKEEYIASDSTFLSTLLCIVSLPTFYIVSKLALQLPIFK
jgi:predicted permease